MDVNYILIPDNNCDQKFKGTDRFVFIRLVRTCLRQPWRTLPAATRTIDGAWRFSRPTITILVNLGWVCCRWTPDMVYMLQNNFENIHTYTAMYCFSPSGNAHEKVEHVNHWFILQINSSWIIGRSNGETFTPEARVWGRCDTLYHVTRSLIEHHSITWLFLGGCITLHYITINTTATEVCFLCSCFISNLTFMSKLIERMVYQQLIAYLEKHNMLPKHQSGFRAHHSTETAVLRVISDILGAADQGYVALLGLLDMSAAFDTVDHDILLERLATSFGMAGTALAWLRSFLTGRSQQVSFNGGLSSIGLITTGVPQGSVLGPLLFLLYTADVPLIANQHGLGIHCYADDGQIYVFDKAAEAVGMINKVASCIEEIDRWMSSNRLKLNSEKTQFIWLGSRQQLSKVGIDHIHLGNHAVTSQSTVCNLGVHLDGQLTMKVHVQRISQTSFYQLRQLRSVRRSLSVNACSALVHAFVTSRLDYCNSLLAGIGDGLIDQLQTVMRVAARLVLRKRKFDPISADIRDRLHWLPIRSRIDFKLGLLVYKCLHGIAPPYLTEMLVLKSTVPALTRFRSTARGDLLVPRTKTKTIGPRSFATSGPALWNKLPDDLRDPSLSLPVFKQRLKSYLFKQCWCALQSDLTIAATCVSVNAFAFFCEKHRF